MRCKICNGIFSNVFQLTVHTNLVHEKSEIVLAYMELRNDIHYRIQELERTTSEESNCPEMKTLKELAE